MLPTTTGGGGMLISGRPSVRCPSVSTHFGDAIFLHLVNGFRWNVPQIFIMWVGVAEKVFKGRVQRSRSWTDQLTYTAEAYISTVRRRGSLIVIVSCVCPLLRQIVWSILHCTFCQAGVYYLIVVKLCVSRKRSLRVFYRYFATTIHGLCCKLYRLTR